MSRIQKNSWFFLVALVLLSATLMAGRHYDRRYVRISYLEGNVVFRNEADTDWAAGSVNTPLQETDRVYAPLNSRVEIEFDDGSYLRLAEDTEIRILRLEKDLVRVEMPLGLATLRYSGRVDFQLQSPVGMVRFADDGLYRLEVLKDGGLDVAVRKGKAEIFRGAETIKVGRKQAVYIPVDTVREAGYRQADQEDAWDSWNDRRDALVFADSSDRYLASGVYIGVQPLNSFGVWVNIGGSYGWGWSPIGISYNWSPYRHGRWISRPYWGWTWVSYEPWGWLPYHYGSWHYHPVHRWCWLPGHHMGFNFWSPGRVHFYHHQGRVHWLPLGPRDYYHHDNFFYNTHVTIHNTYIQNEYRHYRPGRDLPPENLSVRGSLLGVDRDNLVNGKPFEFRQIPEREIAQLRSPVGSLRDLDLQPNSLSRSPHPEITARGLHLADLRHEGSLQAMVPNKTEIRPTIRPVAEGAGGSVSPDRARSVGRSEAAAGSESRGSRLVELPVDSSGRRQMPGLGSRSAYEAPSVYRPETERGASVSGNTNSDRVPLTSLRRGASDTSGRERPFYRNDRLEEKDVAPAVRNPDQGEGSSPARVYEPRRRTFSEPSGGGSVGTESMRTGRESSTVTPAPEVRSGGATQESAPSRRQFPGSNPAYSSPNPSTGSSETPSRRTFERPSVETRSPSTQSESPRFMERSSQGTGRVYTERSPSISPRSSGSMPETGRGRDVWVSPRPSAAPQQSAPAMSAPSRPDGGRSQKQNP